MTTLFLYLNAFSITGGIEKFNKAFMKALDDISADKEMDCKVLSAYDDNPDEKYVSPGKFKGYKGSRINFTLAALKEGIKADKVFIGHINLAVAGILIKLLNPGVKIYLTAHGIEIWDKISFIKKYFLKKCNYILAVSSYTKKCIAETHSYPADRIIIFPNTLDPYFRIPGKFEKPVNILEKFKIDINDTVLLTLGRLSSVEGKKGYDKVIAVLPEIKNNKDGLKYLIVGKYDQQEYSRIQKLIVDKKLEDDVILTGFVSDEELTDYYLSADIFVMPSKQEGFGIVFLEALVCGLTVIAGNKDGSIDVLKNGELGTLIDPDNSEQLKTEILNNLNVIEDKEFLSSEVQETFGFEKFKERLEEIITSPPAPLLNKSLSRT